MYKAAFFKTKASAELFIRLNGGVLGANVKRSRKKKEYYEALAVAGFPAINTEEYPYSVTWREFEEEVARA